MYLMGYVLCATVQKQRGTPSRAAIKDIFHLAFLTGFATWAGDLQAQL